MMLMNLSTIQALDAADPLRHKRDDFVVPDHLTYLDGNSLGLLPKSTLERVSRMICRQWGGDAVMSWNIHGWIGLPQRLGAQIAPLIGAEAKEVIVADSASVNVFKLLAAACKAQGSRTTILSEPGNFPTDLYIAQGVAELLQDRHVRTVCAEEIVAAIDADTAVVLLTHVHYKSGRKLDMAAITAAAHAKGALVLWDLCHSAGAVPVNLNACGADLAIGCGYKFLNGGPGAPAFLFVAEALQESLRSPLSGWMGHAAPFAFDDDYVPARGIGRFLCGTPSIIAMAALEQGIASFEGTDLELLWQKARQLSQTFIELVDAKCSGLGLRLISPRDPYARGSHVSFAHDEDAYAVCQALIARGVIPDFRAPDAVRFGFTPLYTSFEDVWKATETLRDVLAQRAWEEPAYQVRAAVT
jgi:kynureninase